MTEPTTQDPRQNVFRALIESQDSGLSVADSRAKIAAQFNLTTDDIRGIERAGIDAKWPPL